MTLAPNAPAQLTPRQLRRRNKELATLGKRICRTHQGAALPLDDDHFYRQSQAQGGYFDTECKVCKNRRVVQRITERRKTDAAYAEKLRAWKRSNHAQNRDAVNRRRRLKRYERAFHSMEQALVKEAK